MFFFCQGLDVKHPPSFGIALRIMRNAKGLKQDALGITQTNISKLELGKRIPSWVRVDEIADTLNVHPLSLFTLAYMERADRNCLAELLAIVQSEIDEIVATQGEPE
ncbi:helix-turn-helix domain-containing protein [Pseudomonas sp. BGr12]|uniref:helix-turn-helix domain-containing protein n=1 Tax=Pseudomonas sp. BGr12 TaxID=2936269 RepID=UPI0033353ACE